MKKVLLQIIFLFAISICFSSTKVEAASINDTIVNNAFKYMGVPYVFGGTTPNGFDCSGFTQYVYKQSGISISRTTIDQYNQGTSVSKSNLIKGDLVFFKDTYRTGVSHVGIYIGDNKFIHASSSNGVTITSLNSDYYVQHWLGAKRIAPSSGWTYSNGYWYFYENGVMKTGWIKDNSKWYYLNSTGEMRTGWLYWNNDWYYLTAGSGEMVTGWSYIGSNWYYFYSSGAMAKNTKIDGYVLDSNGVWVH